MNLLDVSAHEQRRVFHVPIRLHPAQRLIDLSLARFKIVRSGRKFGKTTYARKKCLDWMGPPNSCVWFIGPTYKQTKLVAWSDFKRMIPPDALKKKPNDTDLIITLKNGSELYMMGSDEPDTLRGPAPTGVVFEEVAQHKREVWHEVIRPNLVPHKAPALFIGTPKGFNWFKDLEDAAQLSRLQGGLEWEVFHFTIYDNPTLDPLEVEQAKRDCQDNPAVWRQEYMAEYESSVGRVFPQFSDLRHMAQVPMPGHLSASRAIDYGMRDDTACLWAYIKDGKLFIYREYADNDLPASTQAQIITAKTTPEEKIERNIIGHDAAKQDVEMRGLTVAWHFSKAGVRPLRIGSKDKRANRAGLMQLINEDRILIDKSCVKLRKQILNYEWKDTVLEKTEDGDDDLVDTLHSMVELYQYDLFNPKSYERPMTYSEMLAHSHAERIHQKAKRFPLTEESKPMADLNVEDTVAGYV